MTIFKKYRTKVEAQIAENDIVTSINAIVSKCEKLPYNRQLETLHRIQQSLTTRKKELEDELSEVNGVITKITIK